MQGEEYFSTFLGLLDIPVCNPGHEGEIGGSTPQLSQQDQQGTPWPSRQPAVPTHQGSTPQFSLQDQQGTPWPSQQPAVPTHQVDMVTSPCKTCNNCEKMKKDMKKMKRDISYMTELVENTIENTIQLWEFLEETEKELQQQQNSRTESATGRKHSKEKQKVDPLCRDTFRKMYKSLEKKDNSQGFNFKESFDSAENEEVFKKVKGKMSGNNGSCKWTDEQIKIVSRRYFLSLCETDRKKSDNKYDEHKTNSRRQNRKKQKLSRRTGALDKIDWVIREKEKAAEVLTEEYMSSEVSESGEESLSGDEGCSKEKKLYIKTVPWESEDLKTLKSKLDVEYASHQTSRSRRREFQRDRRPEDVSSRPKPKNGPSWAFRKDDGQ